MPLASDASTGGKKQDVDRSILAAAAAAASAASRPSTLEERVAPARSIIGPSQPNFRPDADISAGRVRTAPGQMMGPFAPPQGTGREPGDYDRVLGLVRDELGMKAGALTTTDVATAAERRGATDRTSDEPIRSQGDHLRGPDLPDRDEAVRAELREAGLWGSAVDVGVALRAERERATGRRENTRAEDEAEMSEAERSFKSGIRATRRGMNSGGRAEKTQAMTADEYAALSPRQKAAVELNTMLTEAIKADLAIPRSERTPGDKQYTEAVEALFRGEGAEATKRNYSPNVVDVLTEIGWQGPAGTDLKDVTSGKMGFTRQDIDDLGPSRGGPDASLTTGNSLRDSIQSSLVKAFAGARKDTVAGPQLLESKQQLLGYDSKPGFSSKVGRTISDDAGNTTDTNTYMRTAWEFLADSNSGVTPEMVFADARNMLDEQEFQQFLDFVDTRSRDSKSYRRPLGEDSERTYFDPVEFRRAIAASLRKEQGDAGSRR